MIEAAATRKAACSSKFWLLGRGCHSSSSPSAPLNINLQPEQQTKRPLARADWTRARSVVVVAHQQQLELPRIVQVRSASAAISTCIAFALFFFLSSLILVLLLLKNPLKKEDGALRGGCRRRPSAASSTSYAPLPATRRPSASRTCSPTATRSTTTLV